MKCSIPSFRIGRRASILFCGIVAVLSANHWGAAQEVSTSDSTDVSVSKTWDVTAVEEYVQQARKDWQVPGLAVAIVKDDQVVLSKGFGVKQVGTSDAVDEHTLFAIASNTKAFTAASLAILVDEGKLNWDDPVSNTLPWLKLADPHATADLRIRDLLCHRSGLGTFSGDLLWWGTNYTPRQVLQRAARLQPAAPFRSKYGYSNLMFLAAGEVIEQVSGQSWSDFVRQRILNPTKMNRTIASVRDLVSQGNYASPHKTYLDRSVPHPWVNWDTMVSAGGIISSASDMSQWMRLQLRNGELADGTRVFSGRQSQEMWQAQTPMSVSESYRKRFPTTHFRAYGLGWSLADYQGKKIVSHGGGYDGMYSQVLMVPEEKLGIVVLTNSMTSIAPSITYRVVDAVLGGPQRDWSQENLATFRESRKKFKNRIKLATTPSAEGTQPSRPLTSFSGTYRCPMYGDATVQAGDDGLVLKLLPNPDLVADLKHLHYDTFIIRWRKEFAWFGAGTAHFISDSRGEFDRLELNVPNDDMWFHELDFRRTQ